MASVKDLLVELIKIPSYVDPKEDADESKLCDFIYNFFLKFKEKDPALIVEKQPVEANRYNIIVSKGMPKILLGFHLDTVPPRPSDWIVTKPFEPVEKEDRLYGRGAADMKASIAVIMSSFEERHSKLNNFYLLFTVDEEYDFKGINKFLETTKIKPELVVFCEPTDLKIANKHRGIIQTRITSYGKSAHAGTPKAGINAIEVLVGAMKDVEHEVISEKFSHPELGNCAFNLAYVQGGQEGSYNSVPDKTIAVLDIRNTPKLTIKALEGLIREKLRRRFKLMCEERKLSFSELYREPEVKIDFAYGALITAPKELQKLEATVKKLLGKAEYTIAFGITEAGLVREKLDMPSCNFGPGSRDSAHKPDEHVNLADLDIIKKVYENLLNEGL